MSKVVSICGELWLRWKPFLYNKSHFNTNETLTKFLLSSKGKNQDQKHQLVFHVCESSCMEMFSLLCLGVLNNILKTNKKKKTSLALPGGEVKMQGASPENSQLGVERSNSF